LTAINAVLAVCNLLQQAVKYGKLLVATGAAPLKLKPTLTSPDVTPSTGCYCVEHPDVRLLKLDAATVESCGHGSAHYLHDIGDAHKLVKALSVPTASEEVRVILLEQNSDTASY
jgi:hypothetical protein